MDANSQIRLEVMTLLVQLAEAGLEQPYTERMRQLEVGSKQYR